MKIFLGLSLLAAGSIAVAGHDLILNNYTNNFVTSKIYGTITQCSSSIPGGSGVIRPNEIHHVVNASIFAFACGSKANNCLAEVYLDNDCGKKGGSLVGKVTISTTQGIKSIVPIDYGYNISGTNGGFELSLTKN